MVTIFTMLSFNTLGPKQKEFPGFETVDLNGKTWTEQDLQEGKTLAVVMHLGCTGAMPLLNDLDSLKRINQGLRIILFCKNTREQLEAFFHVEESEWQKIRNHFGVKQNPDLIILPQCDEPLLKKGEVVLTQQCRGISKQLKTKSSPTIFFVDDGLIKQKQEGYLAMASLEERMKWLEDFTN